MDLSLAQRTCIFSSASLGGLRSCTRKNSWIVRRRSEITSRSATQTRKASSRNPAHVRKRRNLDADLWSTERRGHHESAARTLSETEEAGYVGGYNWRASCFGLLMLVVVNFAATQYVAARFQYQDALGYPASRTQSGVGIYEPFAWMIWGFHNSTSQDPRVRRPLFEGEMIVFFGSILCVGLFYVAAGRRSRRLMQNADDLHGSARWATEADVRATGLMDAEEGGQRSDLQNIANRGASRIIHTVCYCAVAIASLQAQSSTAGSLTRLYVEPFTTKSGSERFRADLIAELRKVRSISLVPAASNTAASLAGGGEIWIKGYRSLNPRNRMPSDATVVYGGFMSVELKDANGETVWSDLVTPGGATEDISKDLSKRIAKDVAEALQAEIQPAPTTTRPNL